ncbi:hypothetical protein HK405_013587 [Cladochytrium tenue]|nr:hypothetical protein HK405_013587 [Cladochytrium tenue]
MEDLPVDLNKLDPFDVSVVVQQQLPAGGAANEINEDVDGGDVDDTDALRVLDGADVAPPVEYDGTAGPSVSGLEESADADTSAHLSTASVQANVSSATFMQLLPGDASGVFTSGDDNEDTEVSEGGHSCPDSFTVEPSMAALNGVSGLFAHPPELPLAARADSPPPPAMQLHELPALQEEEDDDDEDGDVLEATDPPCVSVVLNASVADFAGLTAAVASLASVTTLATRPPVAGTAEVGWSADTLPPPPPSAAAAFAFTEAATQTTEEARAIAHKRLAGLRRVLAARVDGGGGFAVRPGETADAAHDRAFVETHRSLKDLRAFVADAALRASRQRSLIEEGVLDLEAARDLVVDLNDIVDWDDNLTFTLKHTNMLKGRAVTKFLDDYATGHRRSNGDLTAYLLSNKLERHVTAEICKQMNVALRNWIYELDNAGTTTMEALAVELQNLFATMGLNN